MYGYLFVVLLFASLALMAIKRLERQFRYKAGSAWTITAARRTKEASLIVWTRGVIIAMLILVIWQLLFIISGPEALASPERTFSKLASFVRTQAFWLHVAETIRALAMALLISVVGGVALGVILGMNLRAGEIIEPMIVAFQSTPNVTLYPIVLLIFGLGIAAKVGFGVMHGSIPMTLITLNAIRSVNPALKRTALALRLTRWQTFSTVFFPATLPEIATAFRISFSVTFIGVLVGELFSSNRGLGFLIMNGINVNDNPTIMAATLVVATFSVAGNALLVSLDRRLRR